MYSHGGAHGAHTRPDWFLLLQVGLGQVLELAGELLQYLQTFLVALVYRAEGVRELSVQQIRGRALTLMELSPVRQVLELPVQVQKLLKDLQELSKILLQLLVNSTPLYNMVSGGRGQGAAAEVSIRKSCLVLLRGFCCCCFFLAI